MFHFVQTRFGALFMFSFLFRRVSERCLCFISFRRVSKRCSYFRLRSDAFRSAVHAFVFVQFVQVYIVQVCLSVDSI